MSDSKKKEDLNKTDLIHLKEILQRENILLSNSRLMEKLPDKGESIKIFRDRVEAEIKFRENLQYIQASINKSMLNDTDKHVQKLCEIEKIPEKERYKPFATLNNVKEVQADSKIFKIMEDCVHCNKPTKLIALPESIDILKKQDERIKEEQLRSRHRRILEKLKEYEEDEENEEENENNVTNSTEEYLEPEEEEMRG